jgi:hypothetical protein
MQSKLEGIHRFHCKGCGLKGVSDFKPKIMDAMARHREEGCTGKIRVWVMWVTQKEKSAWNRPKVVTPPATPEMIAWATAFPDKPMPAEMLARWRESVD